MKNITAIMAALYMGALISFAAYSIFKLIDHYIGFPFSIIFY